MPAGRGFATAVCLVLIALVCIGIAKRLERERRLLRKLRARLAFDAQHGVSLEELTDGECEIVTSLERAGVLRVDRNHCHLEPVGYAAFRRKRLRLTLSGALMALALAVLVAFTLLR
jgi:hypothetical protein